jgi:hypothetical protein
MSDLHPWFYSTVVTLVGFCEPWFGFDANFSERGQSRTVCCSRNAKKKMANHSFMQGACIHGYPDSPCASCRECEMQHRDYIRVTRQEINFPDHV